MVRGWNFFPRTLSWDVGHEGLGVELVVLCTSDDRFHLVHEFDVGFVR